MLSGNNIPLPPRPAASCPQRGASACAARAGAVRSAGSGSPPLPSPPRSEPEPPGSLSPAPAVSPAPFLRGTHLAAPHAAGSANGARCPGEEKSRAEPQELAGSTAPCAVRALCGQVPLPRPRPFLPSDCIGFCSLGTGSRRCYWAGHPSSRREGWGGGSRAGWGRHSVCSASGNVRNRQYQQRELSVLQEGAHPGTLRLCLLSPAGLAQLQVGRAGCRISACFRT